MNTNPTRILHFDTHPEYVEGCWHCRMLSVSISSTAMPTRKVQANNTILAANQFAKDEQAYRNLRKDGLQPRQVDGSAEIQARAETKAQVEQ